MPSNNELLEIRRNETPRGVATQTDVFADKARNAEIWDVEGNRYIDLAAGIAVVNTGHNRVLVERHQSNPGEKRDSIDASRCSRR